MTKVLAIRAPGRDQGEFVLTSLHEVTGTDASVALPDEEGLLREAAIDLPAPNQIMVRMPIS